MDVNTVAGRCLAATLTLILGAFSAPHSVAAEPSSDTAQPIANKEPS